MHITEFEKLNYNYIIQELALKNEYGTLSRKSTLNLEEYNINKKIKLQPLSKNKLEFSSDLTQTHSIDKTDKTSENDCIEQDHSRIINKSFQAIYGININNEYNDNFNYDDYFNENNKNLSFQSNKNEKSTTNINANNNIDSTDSEIIYNKHQKSNNVTNENLINESDEELYEINDETDEVNTSTYNNVNQKEEQDNNIFRRGQQKFISSSKYRTKNMNRLYHLLNSVTPLYKLDATSKKPSIIPEDIENQSYSYENATYTKEKKFKVLRFNNDDVNELNVTNNEDSSMNCLNSYMDNYVELSCKLLNSRIRLGKPIPIELEVINKGSKSIPYLKFEVHAITNNENHESFCEDKIMFAYFLEPGKKCIKKFLLEPYLWNNEEEDNFYDDIKNLNLNSNMGSNTLYSTSNLSNTKSNLITNRNFSSYYYYSKIYAARNKYSKTSEKEKGNITII